MSLLAEALREKLPAGDPITFERLQILDNWSDLVQTIREPFLKKLTGPAWEYHDDQGVLQWTPYTTPDWFRRYWWPDASDSCAIATFDANGSVKRVHCLTRTSPQIVHFNVTFGKLPDSNFLHPILWDMGIRALEWYVHGEKQKAKLLERGEHDSIEIRCYQNPDRPTSIHGIVYLMEYVMKYRPDLVTFEYHPGDPRWRNSDGSPRMPQASGVVGEVQQGGVAGGSSDGVSPVPSP